MLVDIWCSLTDVSSDRRPPLVMLPGDAHRSMCYLVETLLCHIQYMLICKGGSLNHEVESKKRGGDFWITLRQLRYWSAKQRMKVCSTKKNAKSWYNPGRPSQDGKVQRQAEHTLSPDNNSLLSAVHTPPPRTHTHPHRDTHFLFLCSYQITTIGAFQQLFRAANDGKTSESD